MFMGESVSESVYGEKKQAFKTRYEKLNLHIGVCKLESAGYSVWIDGKEAFSRSGLTEQNLRACMLACYRAFSCGK